MRESGRLGLDDTSEGHRVQDYRSHEVQRLRFCIPVHCGSGRDAALCTDSSHLQKSELAITHLSTG